MIQDTRKNLFDLITHLALGQALQVPLDLHLERTTLALKVSAPLPRQKKKQHNTAVIHKFSAQDSNSSISKYGK